MIKSLILAIILSGCVALQPAKTLETNLAYSYASLAAVQNTIVFMVETKKLTVEEAIELDIKTDQMKVHLDTAKSLLVEGKVQEANTALEIAMKIMTSLEVYLQGKTK